MALAATACSNDSEAGLDNGSGDGQGGSMARFTIVDDYLYVVNNSSLVTFSLNDPTTPKKVEGSTYSFGSEDIETIFPFDGRLFVGSQRALYVFDISSDPSKPYKTGQASHFMSCDPVVAAGDYAYVTLNGGRNCNIGGINQLLVYDISTLLNYNPIRVGSPINMTNPLGLGVDGAAAKLFVCNNDLDVFDLTDPAVPAFIGSTSAIPEARDMEAEDVIVQSSRMAVIVTAADGLYQFDYSGEQLSFISHFPISSKE